MKKIIAIAFVALAALFIAGPVTGQSLYSGGKNVNLKFPRGIDSSKNYTFPTFEEKQTVGWDDTLAVSVTDLETYVNSDSVAGNTLVNISLNSYVLPGAKLYLKLASTATDTIRLITVKQGSTVIDSFYCGRVAYAEYVLNQNTFQRVFDDRTVNYLATVTQATSITTGVTLNADAGVITTVSSTMAADDSSASFTFTNSFIKSTSVLQLTCSTAGNGAPYAQITSISSGSAVIKLYNLHRTAALNNTIKIHFLILNK